MRIRFEPDTEGIYFAVSYNSVWKGYFHEELIWAELTETKDGVVTRFESDYYSPVTFPTMNLAKDYVKKFHEEHEPLSQGTKKIVENL